LKKKENGRPTKITKYQNLRQNFTENKIGIKKPEPIKLPRGPNRKLPKLK